MNKLIQAVVLLAALAVPCYADVKTSAFDHSAWSDLLSSHVSAINAGKSTMVDYAGFKADRKKLKKYLDKLSAVSQTQFDEWPNNKQLAFLINAYNAWTVELILTEWPDLESIKDLGGFFRSPWSKKFVPMLAKKRSLDDIEHELIRGSGRYKEPRIHFAVNCASIGCPALRAEAYQASSLEQQLDEQTNLFLSDQTRNQIDADIIKLSSIFKWYKKDFEKGWQSFYRLEDFLLAHADALGVTDDLAKQLKAGEADIEFLDYDWHLNKK